MHSKKRADMPPIAAASPRKHSLLPAFEPLFSSSPGGLPRVAKRKFDEHHHDTTIEDDRKYYPTPVPTSSTGILPSSPVNNIRSTRPKIQRAVSSLSERAPLGAVPSLDLPANGEPLLMGRSSNSSDYQLSASRLISRVHVRATYHAPSVDRSQGEVTVECLGWNGCKVHCRGSVVELAKGEVYMSDKPGAQIMVDVQDTRVLLMWPRTEGLLGKRGPSPSVERSLVKAHTLPSERFASSPPPMFGRLCSPESPTPAGNNNLDFGSTFIAGQSFSSQDDGPVQVYEDNESVMSNMQSPVQPLVTSQSSALSEPEELSEHDEENDPIVHSFGPFGENLLCKFESFKSASPDRLRKPLQDPPTILKLRHIPGPSTYRPVNESPIKNHVVNQLAFSRIHSLPLSTIYSNLPAEMKRVEVGSTMTAKMDLTSEELKTLLDKIACVGEIPREGKDAADIAKAFQERTHEATGSVSSCRVTVRPMRPPTASKLHLPTPELHRKACTTNAFKPNASSDSPSLKPSNPQGSHATRMYLVAPFPIPSERRGRL